MNFDNISLDKDGRVAVLTIRRPDKKNALNRASRLEIREVQREVEADDSIGVLVITGEGDSFIAGSDLNELSRMDPVDLLKFLETLGQRLYTRFEDMDKPVLALINGLCLGGGNEVALSCDIRLASEKARFGQPEVNLGIIPGSGATQRLTRLVGAGKASELIFTGDIIKAEEALRIGLVNQVLPHDELMEKGLAMAHKIAGRGAYSLAMAKRSIRMSREVGLKAGLSYEALSEMACFTHPDKEEGMRAFFEKRKPGFNK